jgi:hypothetical protein
VDQGFCCATRVLGREDPGVRLAVEPDGGKLSMPIALNGDVSTSSFEQWLEEVVAVEVLASSDNGELRSRGHLASLMCFIGGRVSCIEGLGYVLLRMSPHGNFVNRAWTMSTSPGVGQFDQAGSVQVQLPRGFSRPRRAGTW